MPTEVGEYDTRQTLERPDPVNVQVVALKLPAPLEEKNTGPVGVVAFDEVVSVIVAVHVVLAPMLTDEGLQLKLVDVERPDITYNSPRPAFAT